MAPNFRIFIMNNNIVYFNLTREKHGSGKKEKDTFQLQQHSKQTLCMPIFLVWSIQFLFSQFFFFFFVFFSLICYCQQQKVHIFSLISFISFYFILLYFTLLFFRILRLNTFSKERQMKVYVRTVKRKLIHKNEIYIWKLCFILPLKTKTRWRWGRDDIKQQGLSRFLFSQRDALAWQSFIHKIIIKSVMIIISSYYTFLIIFRAAGAVDGGSVLCRYYPYKM